MRRKLIQTYKPDPDGPSYGRVVQPGDLMDMQEFSKRRVDLVLRDFVTRTAAVAQVEGFAHALPGGLVFRVAAGHAVDLAGLSYETYPVDENTDLQIGAAPPANARIDLVYASLIPDQDAEPELLLHRRLRTQGEYEQNVPEYDPAEVNVNTERRNVAVLGVRAGAVAANPVAPAVGVNEVPLYHVRVDAGDVAVAAGKVTDVRNRMRSLFQLTQNVAALEASPAIANLAETIDDRVAALLLDTASVVKAYNDAAGTLSLSVPAEYVQDVVGAFLAQGVGISINYNDAGNVATITADAEFIQDTVAALLRVTANTGLGLVYDDATAALTLSGVAATGVVMGMMPAADKAAMDARTSAATVSTIMTRDANGDTSARDFKPTRRIQWPDNSVKTSAFRVEQYIELFNLRSAYVVQANDTVTNHFIRTDTVANQQGNNSNREFEVWIDPADFAGVNCTFEVIGTMQGNFEGFDIELWNATDGVVVAGVARVWYDLMVPARSQVFTFSGTGRKRLVVRARATATVMFPVILNIFRARIVMRPVAWFCGYGGLPACSLA